MTKSTDVNKQILQFLLTDTQFYGIYAVLVQYESVKLVC